MGKSKKIIGMGLGLAVLVSSVSFAFAANGHSQSTSDTSKSKYQSLEHFKGRGQGQRVNILSTLVTAGTITADQQKAIQTAMKPSKDSQKTMKESLDSLVTTGTITQVQEDAIIKAYDDAKAKMQAEQEKRLEEMAKEKGITVAELKTQMEQQKPGMGMKGEFRGKGHSHGQRSDITDNIE
jgi:hypothetical protein